MAWGYWSATSVGDRGRSPRREKDKQSIQNSQQQSQITSSEYVQGSSGVQQMQQGDLNPASSVPGPPGLGMGEDPSCALMIQGASFYSYSAAAAAAAAAAGRRASAVEGAALQAAVHRGFAPGTSGNNFASNSPCSDSADDESSHGVYVHQDGIVQMRRPNDHETDDHDHDDVELIYASNALAAGCLLHGPCNPTGQDVIRAASASGIHIGDYSAAAAAAAAAVGGIPPGTAQFGRFNNITWGRSWPGRDSTESNGTRCRFNILNQCK